LISLFDVSCAYNGIFFIGINIVTNWQKGSLKVTAFWGIISLSLADGYQLSKKPFPSSG